MKVFTLLIFTACIIVLSGCSMLSPYKGEFACPDYDRGQCTDVESAYKQSLRVKKLTPEQKKACDQCKAEAKAKRLPVNSYCTACVKPDPTSRGFPLSAQDEQSETMYQREVHKKLAGLLREPITPMVAPPKIMRVLILPYKGDGNELFMMRYTYIMADEPKWIIGDYLVDKE